ncbi:MAG: hypothetical protein WBB68_01100 [Candidatus Moraniibacteriota bacterium]
MDNNTKLVFVAFILAILLLGGVCYQKYFIQRDYSVYAEAPCNPLIETCFVHICDSNVEECTGDPAEDIFYYRGVEKRANQFPNCDPSSQDCVIAQCGEDEVSCSITSCDLHGTESSCSSPDDFSSEESVNEGVDEGNSDEGNEEFSDQEAAN